MHQSDQRTGLGITTKVFHFTVAWATNAAVLVEAATALATPIWSAVSTKTFTDGWTRVPRSGLDEVFE